VHRVGRPDIEHSIVESLNKVECTSELNACNLLLLSLRGSCVEESPRKVGIS